MRPQDPSDSASLPGSPLVLVPGPAALPLRHLLPVRKRNLGFGTCFVRVSMCATAAATPMQRYVRSVYGLLVRVSRQFQLNVACALKMQSYSSKFNLARICCHMSSLQQWTKSMPKWPNWWGIHHDRQACPFCLAVTLLNRLHVWYGDLGCRHISSGQMADVGGQHVSSFFFILGLHFDVHPGRSAHIRSCGQQHKSCAQT